MEHPLKTLRTSLNLTQEEIGDAIGVTRGRICQIEKNGGTLGPENLLRLAERYRPELTRLGFTVEDFLRREEPRRSA